MKCLTLMLAASLLLMLAGVAAAAPSFFGYTGLIVVPTADALSADEWNVGAFSSDLGPRLETFEGQFGLRNGVEVGVARLRQGDDRDTVLMGKYAIAPETDRRAGLAVGIFDPTDQVEATVYFAASKTFGRTLKAFDKEITSVRGTIGFGGGALDGIFLGASGALGNRLLLMAELVNSNLADGDSHSFNVGARLNVGGGFRLHGAFFDNFDDFGYGASYNKTF